VEQTNKGVKGKGREKRGGKKGRGRGKSRGKKEKRVSLSNNNNLLVY